jgi:hypothetical protein
MQVFVGGLIGFVAFLSCAAFAGSEVRLIQDRDVTSAQVSLCFRMVTSAQSSGVEVTTSGLNIRPLNKWLYSYQGPHQTIEEMMNDFPVLLTLSDERDEGGYAEIQLHEPGTNEPKIYKFERAVIAGLSSEKAEDRNTTIRNLQKLVTYINEMASDTNLPLDMQTMWGLGEIFTYSPKPTESSNLNLVRFKRVLDVKSNLLQALVIIEELERWGRLSEQNQTVVKQVLENNSTHSLGRSILSSILNSPFSKDLSHYRRATMLENRLVARLHRIAGIYRPDETSVLDEVDMHLDHVVYPLFERAKKRDLAAASPEQIFGTDQRFRDMVSKAHLDRLPSWSLHRQTLNEIRTTLRDPRYGKFAAVLKVLDETL